MANSSWSLLAGGAALGIAAGFVLALQWSDRRPVPAPAPGPAAAPAAAQPSDALVKAIEAQAARITRLERDVERLSGTVVDLTRALREATAGDAAPAASPGGSVLPWLPRGGLNVAKAWYAERLRGEIDSLAAEAQAAGLTAEHQRALAARLQGLTGHAKTLQRATTEAEFAAWLQSTPYGERVPTRDELDATARRLREAGK